MQLGLIGLQYSGKTTLFQTLAGGEGAARERASIDVPDERLDNLTEIFNPKKQVNATLEAFDVPGLSVGDDGKVKITSGFLNAVKNNDALFHVVRAFKNDAVPHPEGSVDPARDVEFLETEFLFADMAMIENRIEKLEKEINKSRAEEPRKELPIFEKLRAHTEAEKPLRTLELEERERKALSGYQFLTLKPTIVGVNFSDDGKDEVDETIAKVKAKLPDDVFVIPFFAGFELELTKLDEEEAEEFKSDLGVEESALARIIRVGYDALGLHSFFTVGEDECRAWTVKKGASARDAAGAIHTDFYDRFIRAEVVGYDDFVERGSIAKCKDYGVWRLEGKEYVVKDGDILNIRHG